MSEYLSKEEIKQWRSSLEKITLEEFAARLGKKLAEDKPTNDIVDIVLKGQPVISTDTEWSQPRTEKLSNIAEKAFEREKQIAPSPFIHKHENNKKSEPKKSTKSNIKSAESLREEVRIVFKKALTDREQKVFDYFAQNSNKIVYAKDLAALLDLPRDYVYKYIKNLRAKIEGDNLKNADKGGFILTV